MVVIVSPQVDRVQRRYGAGLIVARSGRGIKEGWTVSVQVFGGRIAGVGFQLLRGPDRRVDFRVGWELDEGRDAGFFGFWRYAAEHGIPLSISASGRNQQNWNSANSTTGLDGVYAGLTKLGVVCPTIGIMLLTISTTHQPATDLGFLVYKNPSRFQSFSLPFGRADVFYPEADNHRCTVALLLDIVPVGLVRPKSGASRTGGWLEQYVNDRPYVASSHLSVAIAKVFGSALAGNSKDRPDLARRAIPLEARVPVVPSREGADLIGQLFEPLGYAVEIEGHPLDERFPEWGSSPYFGVRLASTIRLRDLLSHLYVLLPVLDDHKHYWVGDDEVAKLLRFGEGWLGDHPLRDLISRRYLKHQRGLVNQALVQLLDSGPTDPGATATRHEQEEQKLEAPLRLGEQRIQVVLDALRNLGAAKVLDLGCGEGRLINRLLGEASVHTITGLDVSHRILEAARRRLRLEALPAQQRERVSLLHGSLTYKDRRLSGHDAAVAMEVIEHIDPPRLDAFEEAVFGTAQPNAFLITTPNAEYNALFDGLPAGAFRHGDHRFEWTRAQFRDWSRRVADRRKYDVRFQDIGPVHPAHGSPTQMGVFRR